MVDKEVLALLRILDICYTQLVTRSIKVLTRHSTLAWLLHSSGLQGRLGRWAALLSSWALEIVKCTKGEDEILGVIAASITPRKEVDSILISIAPRKQPRQVISMPPPTVEPGERLLVVSFDGSARVKRSGGAYSGIVWNLPEWTVISAASKYKLDLTVNEAEYHGLLLCLDLLSDMDLERLRSWPNHELLHMKRDWNQSADSLASAALRRESGVVIVKEEERQDLMTLNRLDELLIAKKDGATVKIAAVTRSRKKCSPQMLQEGIVQRMRMERIRRAQDEEKWIVDLKAYLRGDVLDLTSAEAKSCSKIADRYKTDESGLLFYFNCGALLYDYLRDRTNRNRSEVMQSHEEP
ncbi:Reverse transcriptase [Phytophthora palmivora]|uniref:Reverse transcriptase n=1 Tax=Phytophthora palmivora TaxID=4796 RepID=A0A2P4XPL6_9STRA|nr:Reverse transcriptase [Phytophthora palmivora]